MKALVVGLGSVGLRHANNLTRLGVENICILRSRGLDPPGELLAASPAIVTSMEEALRFGPDLAVVCNPTALHHRAAVPLLEAGIPLYLEKPIAHALGEGEEIFSLASKKSVPVQVGYQYRFHPTLLLVKTWIQEGRIGKIKRAQVEVGEFLPDMHPWEDYAISYAGRKELGGGVVLTFSHEIDYLLWLFGPVRVMGARGGNSGRFRINVEDQVEARLQAESGALIELRMDFHQTPPRRGCVIEGEKGEIHWDYYREATLTAEGASPRAFSLQEGWKRNSLFLDSMQNFLSLVRSTHDAAPPACPLASGLAALRLCDEILRHLTDATG